jgi:hypothetical protein
MFSLPDTRAANHAAQRATINGRADLLRPAGRVQSMLLNHDNSQHHDNAHYSQRSVIWRPSLECRCVVVGIAPPDDMAALSFSVFALHGALAIPGRSAV